MHFCCVTQQYSFLQRLQITEWRYASFYNFNWAFTGIQILGITLINVETVFEDFAKILLSSEDLSQPELVEILIEWILNETLKNFQLR